MNIHYQGGKIQDSDRIEKWSDDWTIETAPKTKQIGIYKFKLHHVMSLDGGLIYFCTNESVEFCGECEGRGKHICDACDGEGFISCDFCDGEGTLLPEETYRQKKNREDIDKRKSEQDKKQIKMEFE